MPQLARSTIDAPHYWDDGEFRAYSFAERITEVYEIATTVETDTIYWHNGRTWLEFGEQTLRSEVRAMLRDSATREIVNEVVRNVKHLTRQHREDIFDLPPEKLVLKNGVIDLLTGEYTPLKNAGKPGTHTWVDVEYDPNAVPDRFNDFLFEVLHPDDVSIMWELIGYCLYRGYPYQKAALFLGEGANGKSTLLNALIDFLSEENVSTVELQDFANDRFAAADLEGKLANVGADLSSEALENTGTFKELTGGDRIRAQRKYEPSFEFKNQATLLFSANQAPAAEDNTYAYQRRWLYFEFPNTFSGESAVSQRDLLEQFREEQAGILNMAVESFGDLMARGGFETTVYQKQNEDAHEKVTNTAYAFADEKIVREEGAVLRRTEAYDRYAEWCDETGRTKQGKQAFERAVRKAHAPQEGKDPNDGRYDAWFDVTFSDQSEDTDDGSTNTQDGRLDSFGGE